MRAGNFGPGDTLTPIQSARLSAALGIAKAQKQALDDGVPLAQVEAQTWHVTVEADGQVWHTTAVPGRSGALEMCAPSDCSCSE